MLKSLALILTLISITISCQKQKSKQSSASSSENFRQAVLIYADQVKANSNAAGDQPLTTACIYALNIDANHTLAKDTHARLKGVRPFNPMPVNLVTLQPEIDQKLPQIARWFQIMRDSHKNYPLLMGLEPAPAMQDKNRDHQAFHVSMTDAQRLLELASMHLEAGKPTCPRSIEP
jgi:hypothetical protein